MEHVVRQTESCEIRLRASYTRNWGLPLPTARVMHIGRADRHIGRAESEARSSRANDRIFGTP